MRFSESELQYLIENYPHKRTDFVAKHLNRKIQCIYRKAFELDLKKTKEFLKSKDCGRIIGGKCADGTRYQFKKENIPQNKGVKMSQEIYDKIKKTMFKTGNIPANTKYFGKPYLYSRKHKKGYTEKTWRIHVNGEKRGYLAYLCEQNGIDLTGKKPRLKPDYNFSAVPTIEDIIIVTEAQNVELNSLRRYPEELRKLIYTFGKLNRTIKKQKSNE